MNKLNYTLWLEVVSNMFPLVSEKKLKKRLPAVLRALEKHDLHDRAMTLIAFARIASDNPRFGKPSTDDLTWTLKAQERRIRSRLSTGDLPDIYRLLNGGICGWDRFVNAYTCGAIAVGREV